MRSLAPRETGAYPPFSQIPQGTSERSFAPAVREPFSCSHAQKNSVLLGWSGLFTGMFPAKLRDGDQVTLGNESVTSKSVEQHGMSGKGGQKIPVALHDCHSGLKSPSGLPG